MGLLDKVKRGWNAFRNNKDPTYTYRELGSSYSYRPDRVRMTRGNEKSIVTAVYNRIAMDVADIAIRHVVLDDQDRYLETKDSTLNECLSVEANIDQTPRAFVQDIVLSMFDEGCVAIVPVDTDEDPNDTESFKVLSMRTGKVVDWYPKHVKVRLYNDNTGEKDEVVLPKSAVCIIENPLYPIINEPNSVMQRLIRKLNLLDAIDEQSGSGKLDLIIQLPYALKGDYKKRQAEERRKDIEMQLSGSKYGIAYADATERITQLNRPVENNLLKTIEYLTSMLFSQLGMNQAILDGTADEKTMLNYTNRTINPIISAIVEEMKRKFLTKTARSQRQSIMFFKDPFKLVPTNEIGNIANALTRDGIATPNEFRHILGWKPAKDSKADQLVNSNIKQPATSEEPKQKSQVTNEKSEEDNQNGQTV